MRYSQDEIQLARRLRDAGLSWEPGPGHYVYDEAGLIEQPSPFQPRVYFILDLQHFLRRSGDLHRLKQAMFWLPDYQQCREILRALGVPNGRVAAELGSGDALVLGEELQTLYTMIFDRLTERRPPVFDPEAGIG